MNILLDTPNFLGSNQVEEAGWTEYRPGRGTIAEVVMRGAMLRAAQSPAAEISHHGG